MVELSAERTEEGLIRAESGRNSQRVIMKELIKELKRRVLLEYIIIAMVTRAR